jgi:putative tryptophan/tyrosine transport system substrate-binding protein
MSCWTRRRLLRQMAAIPLAVGAAAWTSGCVGGVTRKPGVVPPRRIAVVAQDFARAAVFVRAFQEALHENGYREGEGLSVEYHSVERQPDRYPALFADLVQRDLQAIMVMDSLAIPVAQRATSNIPIVYATAADPVREGFAASLRSSGNNLTGLSLMTAPLTGKRLELLHEAVPSISLVAAIWNTANPIKEAEWNDLQGAAQQLGLRVLPVEIKPSDDFEAALHAALQEQPDALVTLPDALITNRRAAVVDFAVKQGLPDMHANRLLVDRGGLLAYGADLADSFRQAAGYVAKILEGTMPADLPIQQPTRFELVVNLKAAQERNIQISRQVLMDATEVIPP